PIRPLNSPKARHHFSDVDRADRRATAALFGGESGVRE
ncbi:MAG: hypothetical protein ACI9WU_004558, partial [Myxococcota bacterium]